MIITRPHCSRILGLIDTELSIQILLHCGIMSGPSDFVPAEPLQLISFFNVSTPGRRQSKMLLAMDEHGS